jgi:hypothetical protein
MVWLCRSSRKSATELGDNIVNGNMPRWRKSDLVARSPYKGSIDKDFKYSGAGAFDINSEATLDRPEIKP